MALMKFLLGALPLLTGGAKVGFRGRDTSVAVSANGQLQRVSVNSALSAMMDEYFEGLMSFNSTGPNAGKVVKSALSKMSVQDALRRLDGKLPNDVSALVEVQSRGGAEGDGEGEEADLELSEVSMEKARQILNKLVEEAQVELDDLVIECSEFKAQNRGTYAQVMDDLARLAGNLDSAQEKRTTQLQAATKADTEYASLDKTLDGHKGAYVAASFKKKTKLTAAQNDEAVYEFMLEVTKCSDAPASATGLVQTSKHQGNHTDHGDFAHSAHVCRNRRTGAMRFGLMNRTLQAKLEGMMTPSLRLMVQEALRETHGDAFHTAFLAMGDDTSTTTTTISTTTGVILEATFPLANFPQPQIVDPEEDCCGPKGGGLWSKCAAGEAKCGLLHDNMAQLWGKAKDRVDQLQDELAKIEETWEATEENLNAQMEECTNSKSLAEGLVAEAIEEIDRVEGETGEKEEQARDLAQEYTKTCKNYKKKIEEILFTNICAVRKVRDAVLKHSTVQPPSTIVDCDVGDWRDATDCSVKCDDTCPRDDPYACGGVKKIVRTRITKPNEKGILCPMLKSKMKCNQIKCQVNCAVSQWSGWGKCTKDCGSGLQEETRDIRAKPRNGGKACPAIVESRACNTHSCDKDCVLADWTEWGHCSMACTPSGSNPPEGITKRVRKVIEPIEANGKCPKVTSDDRLEKKDCNRIACTGDEICIAKQDLIIALDASGTMKAEGFMALKDFVGNLTKRYKPRYFGSDTMHMGIILFGNGELSGDDAEISPALAVQELTSDIDSIGGIVQSTVYQKGFTNLAQVFALADVMLARGEARSDAQSAVVVLTDGKIPFIYETTKRANALKVKNVQIMIGTIGGVDKNTKKALKKIVSFPPETNYIEIPSVAGLQWNHEDYAQMFVATFCPKAMSPGKRLAMEVNRGYVLVREQGYPSNSCGRWVDLGWRTAEGCRDAARAVDQACFSFHNNGWSRAMPQPDERRHCYGEAIDVTADTWDTWIKDRTAPACPGGYWINNPYYNVFCLVPDTVNSTFVLSEGSTTDATETE